MAKKTLAERGDLAFRILFMSLRLGMICLTFVCALGAWGRVCAQNPSAPKAEPPAALEKPANPAPVKPAESIPLKSAAGETSTLLKTPLLDEILAELAARRQGAANEPLIWSVAGVSLQGVADGDQATLQANLQIQLLADDKWVKIPLRLNEGTLQDQSHTGPGEATSGGVDPDQGYLWWLKGKGLHVLKFTLIVPLRKDLPTRRLQLTLPPTVVSELKLRVPAPRLTAKGDEQGRARLTVTPTQDGATQIEMIGLGPRLDLSWQPQPDLGIVETVLESRTAITVTVDGRGMLLEANQRVGALQGTFSQFQVRLPRGGELLKLEGEFYKDRTVDPQDKSLVNVTLKDTVNSSTTVDLKWTVRVEIPPQSDRILIEGFEVTKARIQTGHLALRLVGDYRLERIDNQNQFVQRDNLSTLEKAVPAFPNREDISSAWSILRQPFQLAFHLQPEKPHVTVKPRLFLSLSADRMELFGDYDFQIYRGGIEEAQFAWPGWKDEGWKLDPVAPPNQVEETRLDDPAVIKAKLIERQVGPIVKTVDRNSVSEPRQFTLSVHAIRPLPAGQAAQEFTLPAIPGVNLMPADFVLVLADNLDADLRPVGETASLLQTVSQSNVVPLPKSLADFRRRDFRLDTSRARFSVSTTLQKRQINAANDIEITLDGDELRWQQKISYDVAYDRMSQVLLMVPEKLLNRATFSLITETQSTTLNPISTGAAEGTLTQQRLALDSARIGKFDVVIHASMPMPTLMGSSTLEIPLVQSSDTEIASTRVRVQKARRQRLTLVGEGWTPQASQNGAAVWLASTRQAALSLLCEQTDGTGQQGISVPRRLVQSVCSPAGEIFCQARYFVTGQPSILRVAFPPGTTPGKVRWAGELLVASSISPVAGAPGQYQLTLPDVESESSSGQLLTIAYKQPRPVSNDVDDIRELAVPEVIADGVPTQTFWEVQLPVNQHLWTLPAGFTPEYDWQRVGGWWCRVPRQSPEELEKWVSGDGATNLLANLPEGGNRYVFSSLEGPATMTFRTLSAPLIVLLGASLALVFGFVLVNVPSTRHVMTFLWIGFLTALVAMWYPEPVLVLLQPAGLGLVLALLASVAQRWFRKQRVQPVLTLAAPSDVLAATSSREERIPPAVLNETSTKNHHPPFPMTEAGVGL